MFEDRAEFVSQKWVGLARDYLQRRIDAADDRIESARFSLCEVMENAPPVYAGLADGPHGTLGWRGGGSAWPSAKSAMRT